MYDQIGRFAYDKPDSPDAADRRAAHIARVMNITWEADAMTIERLNQYRHLLREIRQLEKQLDNLSSTKLRDSVLTSDGPGGTQRESSVYGSVGGKRKLQAAYRRRIKRLRKERQVIESYIESVKDSYIRQIITLRFVSGLSWQQVADRVGGSMDSVRKACTRHLERV